MFEELAPMGKVLSRRVRHGLLGAVFASATVLSVFSAPSAAAADVTDCFESFGHVAGFCVPCWALPLPTMLKVCPEFAEEFLGPQQLG